MVFYLFNDMKVLKWERWGVGNFFEDSCDLRVRGVCFFFYV